MTVRVLPVEEYPRLEKQGPLALPFIPGQTDIVVVEDEKEIVARMMVMRMTHLEGVWIDPAHRNAGVVNALLRESVRVASAWPDKWVLAGAADDTMRDILNRMKGAWWPGEFYMLGLGG